MDKAKSYEQWAAAGYMLDRWQGIPWIWKRWIYSLDNDQWKNQEMSLDYDYELIRDRLNTLRTIRKNGDIPAMIFNLRTSLSRNLGDMGNPKVFASWTRAPLICLFSSTKALMSVPRHWLKITLMKLQSSLLLSVMPTFMALLFTTSWNSFATHKSPLEGRVFCWVEVEHLDWLTSGSLKLSTNKNSCLESLRDLLLVQSLLAFLQQKLTKKFNLSLIQETSLWYYIIIVT